MKKCEECGKPATNSYRMAFTITVGDRSDSVEKIIATCDACYAEAYRLVPVMLQELKEDVDVKP